MSEIKRELEAIIECLKKDNFNVNKFLELFCAGPYKEHFLSSLAAMQEMKTGTKMSLSQLDSLSKPALAEMTNILVSCPDFGKFLAAATANGGPLQLSGAQALMRVSGNNSFSNAALASLAAVGASEPTTSVAKKRKKNKKKKGNANNSGGNLSAHDLVSTGIGNVLRPRNFLEAALYFSSITMSTVEMAMALEPASFYAPPLLFQSVESTSIWLQNLKKEGTRGADCSLLEWEQTKAIQRKTTGVFAVGLLQTAQHMKPSNLADRGVTASVSVRSNYMKRTMGLYAISLVDQLPPTLAIDNKNRLPLTAPGLNLPKNILLANRKLELNDLKVPSAEQLAAFWGGLPPHVKVSILHGEQTALEKGWINVKKTWCLCKYCRNRVFRVGDLYELFYRAYFDDLERNAREIDPKAISRATPHEELKLKVRKHLFKSLSLLADDILDERDSYLVMLLKRLGRAFEDDLDWDRMAKKPNPPPATTSPHHTHSKTASPREEVCADCAKHAPSAAGDKTQSFSKSPKNNSICGNLPDEFSDDEDYDDGLDDGDDVWDDERMESFYEDFNMMEDEDIIQSEGELPVDEAHLGTSFPSLYDSRLYAMPKPAAPAYAPKSEAERFADGEILYQNLASLLFQFHLVPKFLEAEAIARQRKLLEEELEMEKRDKERQEQKRLAKQKKKEKQRAAKSAMANVAFTEPVMGGDGGGASEGQDEAGKMVDVEATVDIPDDPHLPSGDEEIAVSERETVESGDDAIVGEVNFGDPQKLDDFEAPPGLELSPLSELPEKEAVHTTEILSGERPQDVPMTWFDKILGSGIAFGNLNMASRTSSTSIESLWTPLSLRLSPHEGVDPLVMPSAVTEEDDGDSMLPPGFAEPAVAAVVPNSARSRWSPFF